MGAVSFSKSSSIGFKAFNDYEFPDLQGYTRLPRGAIEWDSFCSFGRGNTMLSLESPLKV